MNLIFDVSEISYRYLDGVLALSDVTFQVAPGERLALLGANGSGKSTLLSLLDGLIFSDSGSIKAYGQELSQEVLKDKDFLQLFRSKIGLVFQSSDVQLFSPSVYEEIAFGPLQLGLSENEVRGCVSDILEMLGIEGLSDRPPFALSAGEKKRVAIGSVLSINPEILLLDEPTNNLDPRTQVWLIELLEELHLAGKTILVATHDLGIAAEVAERAIVLSEDHTILADGPIEKILADEKLLLQANLIHEHAHRHGAFVHRHPHGHQIVHRHEDQT